MLETKVAIIGSGPAGLTAAIYTSRAMLSPIVIAGADFGGQLMTTTDVENYPGFPDAVDGPELMTRMRSQAEKFGATLVQETAQSIALDTSPFTIQTDSQTITAQSVILAMGADVKWLGLPSETRLRGHGVSSCATCDGFFFRGKPIAVIGGGDSAMEEALFLTRFATKVYIIHRRDELRASKIMQAKAQHNPKIEFILNTTVEDILGDNTVTGLKLKNVQTQAVTTLPLEGVFVAIGHVPNSHIIAGQIATDDKGYVLSDHSKSSVPGIFVAGDIHDHRYRQAITAAGAGCAAALEAERYLAHPESYQWKESV